MVQAWWEIRAGVAAPTWAGLGWFRMKCGLPVKALKNPGIMRDKCSR